MPGASVGHVAWRLFLTQDIEEAFFLFLFLPPFPFPATLLGLGLETAAAVSAS